MSAKASKTLCSRNTHTRCTCLSVVVVVVVVVKPVGSPPPAPAPPPSVSYQHPQKRVKGRETYAPRKKDQRVGIPHFKMPIWAI